MLPLPLAIVLADASGEDHLLQIDQLKRQTYLQFAQCNWGLSAHIDFLFGRNLQLHDALRDASMLLDTGFPFCCRSPISLPPNFATHHMQPLDCIQSIWQLAATSYRSLNRFLSAFAYHSHDRSYPLHMVAIANMLPVCMPNPSDHFTTIAYTLPFSVKFLFSIGKHNQVKYRHRSSMVVL